MSNDAPQWQRVRWPHTYLKWGGFLLVILFFTWATHFTKIKLGKIPGLFGKFFHAVTDRYFPPDFGHVYSDNFFEAMLESLAMASLGCAVGLALAVPLAWFAARNVSPFPKFLYPIARLLIMACRSVHETIWTMLFVAIIGYGQFAGVVALSLFIVGFAGKLMAEEVEGISRGQVDAVRTSGGNHLQVFTLAVLPQVRVGWTGIAIYSWDVAFRAATIIGFFGAGGMGFHLRRHVDQLQYQRVAAVLVSIVVMVAIFELLSAIIRAKVAKSGLQQHALGE